MRKSLALLFCIPIFCGCLIAQKNINPEVLKFYNGSNLTLIDDMYFVKSWPGRASEIGCLYKKETKTIDGKEYSRYSCIHGEFFGPIPDANIKTEKLGLEKRYTFKRTDKAQVEAYAMFSAGYPDAITEIKKSIKIDQAKSLTDSPDLEVKKQFCEEEFYVVTVAYYGVTSDIGLKEEKYQVQAKADSLKMKAKLSGDRYDSNYETKKGALAYKLEPTSYYCEKSFEEREKITKDTIKEEVKSKGYVGVAMDAIILGDEAKAEVVKKDTNSSTTNKKTK